MPAFPADAAGEIIITKTMEHKILTEGEEMISDFLIEKNIKYELQKEIYGLKNDYSMFHRRSDFYLPNYGVYLEFLGNWNNPGRRERYKEKMRIYNTNKIACIYIWPENLGALNWLFAERLRAELLKQNKYLELWRFESKEFWKINWKIFLTLIILAIVSTNTWVIFFPISTIVVIIMFQVLITRRRYRHIIERSK